MTREEYEAKKAALIGDIEREFGDVEHDSGVDEWIKSLRFAEYRRELQAIARRWQEISDDWITNDWSSHWIHADAHSYRYYLPAYLSWFLRFMDCKDEYFISPTFHHVVFNLSVCGMRGWDRTQQFSSLSYEQSEVVAHFLVFQCKRMVFLYEQEELGLLEPGHEWRGFRVEHGYKYQYRQFQAGLNKYWGRFLGNGFEQVDFPFSADRRGCRDRWKSPDPQTRAVYEAKKEALRAEIERAFAGVQRKEGMTISEAHAHDNYEDEEGIAEARLLDTEKRWQDVPDESIRGTDWGLSILDAKGFRYYFPAFLFWCLRFADCEDEEADFRAQEAVDFILGIRENGEISFKEKFGLFNDEQMKAVAHFVEFRHEQVNFREELSNLMYDTDEENAERDEETDDELNETWAEIMHKIIQKAQDEYWNQFL